MGAAAKAEDRMVFTLDLDFADLRKFRRDRIPELYCLDRASMGPLAVNEFVLKFAQETDLTSLARCLVIVEPHRIRVRRPIDTR